MLDGCGITQSRLGVVVASTADTIDAHAGEKERNPFQWARGYLRNDHEDSLSFSPAREMLADATASNDAIFDRGRLFVPSLL